MRNSESCGPQTGRPPQCWRGSPTPLPPAARSPESSVVSHHFPQNSTQWKQRSALSDKTVETHDPRVKGPNDYSLKEKIPRIGLLVVACSVVHPDPDPAGS